MVWSSTYDELPQSVALKLPGLETGMYLLWILPEGDGKLLGETVKLVVR